MLDRSQEVGTARRSKAEKRKGDQQTGSLREEQEDAAFLSACSGPGAVRGPLQTNSQVQS